jgi:hypothetical protein
MKRAGACVLHCDKVGPRKYRASFELGMNPRTADSGIRSLARMILALPPAMRTLWDEATVRDFNVGIQSGNRPFSFGSTVRASTVRLVASLGGQISYTVYSPNVGED